VDTTKSFDQEQVGRLLAGAAQDISRALELVDEHLRGPLHGWLRKHFPGLTDDDLASAWADTLVALLKAARTGRYDPGRPLVPWLCKVAHDRGVDYTRRATCATGAAAAAAYDLGRLLDNRHWTGLTPAERHEVVRLIHEAIDALPEVQQMVMRVFVYHYPESADLRALRRAVALTTSRVPPPAAVKRALQKGRAKVRAFLRRRGYSLGE
jgi:DNA-directed RNA polymerase specialized sigma24 family protein